MTCVSLRSGMASSATWFIDHQPARQVAVTTAKIKNLCLTEKSITRLTTAPPAMQGDAAAPVLCRVVPQLVLRWAAAGGVRLGIGGRIIFGGFVQAAFRAHKKVAGNDNSFPSLQTFNDLHTIIKTSSCFHGAGREQ